MALVEIADVSLSDLDSERLWGRYIDRPVRESQTEVYSINISGWVLGRSCPAVAVEVVHEGAVLRRVPINVRRPGVVAEYPEVPEAEQSGFKTTLGLLQTTLEFELLVRVVLQDNSRVPIGTIRGRRSSLHSDFQPRLQPLVLTSLGRTGTTWLMRLLSEHSRIVMHRRYPFELRTAKYWMHMLTVLSEPANHFQSADVNNFHTDTRWIGHNPFYSGPIAEHPQLGFWFGRPYVEQLAAFCQHSIEEFYQQVASSQCQPEPVYFAEKHGPDRISRLIWELYPHTREIILVRDFRDVVCSVLSFNEKRGYVAFGREGVNSDEEYVRQFRASILSLLQSWKQRSDKAHLLRYEDLVLRPVKTLYALLEYLDLDPTPSAVEGMIRRASKDIPLIKQHMTSTDPKRSIGRWRHDLDASLQALCQEAFDDALKEFGYEDSSERGERQQL